MKTELNRIIESITTSDNSLPDPLCLVEFLFVESPEPDVDQPDFECGEDFYLVESDEDCFCRLAEARDEARPED
jgi:hypothetical protein